MDEADAKRLKGLEKEHTELKKMYAEAMLGIKVLQETTEKKYKRGTSSGAGTLGCGAWRLQPSPGLPILEAGPVDVSLLREVCQSAKAIGGAEHRRSQPGAS